MTETERSRRRGSLGRICLPPRPFRASNPALSNAFQAIEQRLGRRGARESRIIILLNLAVVNVAAWPLGCRCCSLQAEHSSFPSRSKRHDTKVRESKEETPSTNPTPCWRSSRIKCCEKLYPNNVIRQHTNKSASRARLDQVSKVSSRYASNLFSFSCASPSPSKQSQPHTVDRHK